MKRIHVAQLVIHAESPRTTSKTLPSSGAWDGSAGAPVAMVSEVPPVTVESLATTSELLPTVSEMLRLDSDVPPDHRTLTP